MVLSTIVILVLLTYTHCGDTTEPHLLFLQNSYSSDYHRDCDGPYVRVVKTGGGYDDIITGPGQEVIGRGEYHQRTDLYNYDNDEKCVKITRRTIGAHGYN